ncbi:MAG: class I SAM-dependent methyltransferase, partial [Chloroflexi bacterium]|nr:class I SAM-dependent methyltransferase [Chloroflexota bacterium]
MKGHRWFAATYDLVNRWGERRLLGPLRRRLLGNATGTVLELGAGTGVSFPYYPRAATIVATEPDPFMLRRARRRAAQLDLPVRFVRCTAETLPFAGATFDTVAVALVLCTVEDLPQSLAEARRVLKPDGTLRFIEHVRADGFAGEVQD